MAILGGSSIFLQFQAQLSRLLRGRAAIASRASYGSVWTDPNAVPIAYDNNTDPRYPKFHTLDGTNPADPANYALQEIDLGPSYDQDAEWAGAIDATHPVPAAVPTYR